MKEKIVIIGGVAGGATAAARLRRLNEHAQIVMLERGEYISFANCGLPYHVGKTIKERDALLLQTVEGMSKRFNIDVRNFSEVISINKEAKTVQIKDLKNQEIYEETYDKLIISTGAKPIKPNIPGLSEAGNVYTLRNIPDMDQIIAHIKQNQVKTATVIGGGFIGLEMVENLVELGINVTLVENANQVMKPLDFELAQMLHQHLTLKGVDLILSKGVAGFKDQGQTIVLNTEEEIKTEMTILSIGVIPESLLAKDAHLELGIRGAIVVDSKLQTSDPSIFAIGDAIQVKDFVTQDETMIPLAWPANRQGRMLADYLSGMDIHYRGTLGTAVAKIFDLTVATTGNNEGQLKQKNIEYQVAHVHPNSHAGYYPGAAPIALKLIFNKQGKILGAQAVGVEGVEKRIDVIATAIKLGGDVFSLPDLELSYAPPYSSAKDPVNIAGYVASNILNKTIEVIQWHEVDELLANQELFIDVREPMELMAGSISGAFNIPLGQLRDRLDELPKDKTIHVLCQVGQRGYNASRILMAHGFNVKNLDGGYKTYAQAKFKVNSIQSQPSQEQKSNQSGVDEKEESILTIDTRGLSCPGPILKLKEAVDKIAENDQLEIKASDVGFLADVEAWCASTGNTLVEKQMQDKVVTARIQKSTMAPTHKSVKETKDGTTLVVFSGDLDKAIASFIIASGAAAMGKKVTLFFTFWGLNVIKKQGAKVKKEGMEKMFDFMMPSHAQKLPISKMNMGGLGSKMIQNVMEQKNIESLPELIKNAQDLGVKFVACTMSMDVMGITEAELIDGVELGGVAAYLGDAEHSGLNLFI